MTHPTPARDIRPSPIAGRWYPGDSTRLASTIDEFLAGADVPAIPGQVIGLLAPHAGYRYSGPVAGHAFKPVRSMDIDTVVVIGPSHHRYQADILTTGHAAFHTPLGDVPVDHAALETLRQTVPVEPVRWDAEHALEIELPFLQRVLGDFHLIPLALIDQSLHTAETLGHALGTILAGRKALLVASSDLSHFYPQSTANTFDRAMLDAVGAFDPVRVLHLETQGQGFACGRGAIAAVMIAARDLGADTAWIVDYATSGDITQDYDQVVGYGAAVFFRSH
jgi:MEMO1 family protein